MALDLCSIVGGNTGGVNCDGKRKTPKMFLAGSKEFNTNDYLVGGVYDEATLQAAVLTQIRQNNGVSGKLFPFPEIGQVAVDTEQDTKGGLTLGPQRRLRKGRPSYTYSVEISQSQFQALLAFDGKTLPVITLDDAGQMWFYRNASNGNIRGEMAYITISGNGFEDGNSAETGVCTISVAYLSVDDFDKRSAFATFSNLAPSDLQGLKDVVLSEPQAHASNVYKIKMKLRTAKIGSDLDIYDDHGAAIAALTFTAGTGANYATSLVITSVATDGTLKALTVTFDSTAFTALASGAKIKLNGPGVSALVGAGILDKEIGFIILTK